jgi:hypothetical protein
MHVAGRIKRAGTMHENPVCLHCDCSGIRLHCDCSLNWVPHLALAVRSLLLPTKMA